MTGVEQGVDYYLERARLARERATRLDDEAAKRQEIKLAVSYEALAQAASRTPAGLSAAPKSD